MNEYADNVWFSDGEFDGGLDTRMNWSLVPEAVPKYINSRRLEITCGEAPFLVQRYDSSTGKILPLTERQGLLDRKMKWVNACYADDEEKWMHWCLRAFQSIYGYEYQGDSLLIARLNMVMSFEDYMKAAFQRRPTKREFEKIINVVTWNLMQMDGITYQIPCCKVVEAVSEASLFDEHATESIIPRTTFPYVKTYNWRRGNSIEMRHVNKGGQRDMKFDFIIGNPPFQDEVNGELRNYAPPIYHLFMEEAFKLADRVELIHPARFLFKAGDTPVAWNKKMLSDEHFKVIYYNEDGHAVFPSLSVPLRGGVAITYRDTGKDFGAIQLFTPHLPMIGIMKKIQGSQKFKFNSLCEIVYSRTTCRLTNEAHKDFPVIINKLSKGHPYDMSSNIFSRIPELFSETPQNIVGGVIKILGRLGNKRVYRYCLRRYINDVPNLDYYKLFVPQASGSGIFGEAFGTPVIEGPGVASTETFISMGKFENEIEAINLCRYITSKFARALLGVLKVTQNGNRNVWKMIPLQDFTNNSDIDWSQSIANIDKQLYAKYDLSPEEINFIETHVKEME